MSDISKRWTKLLIAFESKEEVIKEEKEININEDILKEEFSQFRKLSNQGQLYKGTQFSANPGQTVNSIITQGNNTDSPPPFKNISTNLQPHEALKISVQRTIDSGAPINDIDFYDEVNWNLVNLGFTAQSAVMIKEAIAAMLEK
jgi:hypothetical protein